MKSPILEKGLALLFLQLHRSLWSRNTFTHEEESDDADSEEPVDEHSEESRPLEDRTFDNTRDAEDAQEGRDQGIRHVVDEAGEACSGVGPQEFEGEADSHESFEYA